MKGSATLYSREYFELVKEHLNPGGIVTQWVPLYESDLDTVKSEIATFFDVFPNGTVWANELNGGGYDLFLLGQVGADADRRGRAWRQRLARPDYARVAAVAARGGLPLAVGPAFDLRRPGSRICGRGSRAPQINRDGNLRLQYLAGLALNDSQESGDLQPDAGLAPVPEKPVYGVAGTARGAGGDLRRRQPLSRFSIPRHQIS